MQLAAFIHSDIMGLEKRDWFWPDRSKPWLNGDCSWFLCVLLPGIGVLTTHELEKVTNSSADTSRYLGAFWRVCSLRNHRIYNFADLKVGDLKVLPDLVASMSSWSSPCWLVVLPIMSATVRKAGFRESCILILALPPGGLVNHRFHEIPNTHT